MEAEAAVSSAVQILGDLLIRKVNFLLGVEEQVRLLKDELRRMQSFLKDATKKQARDERVRTWISDIREVAHDAEDAIEIFILKVETATGSRLGLLGKWACFPNHIHHLDKVGKEIESIRRRLQDIDSSRVRYEIKDIGEVVESSSSRSENVERRRRLPTWQDDKHLVGLNRDVESLLQKFILDEEKKGLSIAAIVGMGGIGKSTLAKKIYNHAAVADKFECRVWVVVSSEFTVEDVLNEIVLRLKNSMSQGEKNDLKDLESIKNKQRREHILQEILHKHLAGKRYFVVLDDVWEKSHWDSLKSAFPNQQDVRCRLVITSRIHIISEHYGCIHAMRFLGSNESRELLMKAAFLDGRCPQELESIGEKILNKCGGLPLAITVAGGLLGSQKDQSKSGWEKVLKQITETISEVNSPNVSAISELSYQNVSAILELSYQNLPPRLKPCFLCLGFFKEDAVIKAKRLVHLWVSQGFISWNQELTVEDIAMSYLNELIDRNLVQVVEMAGTCGVVKNCRVHDLLRGLAIRKAKEEIGLEILRGEGNSSSRLSHKPRHVISYVEEGLLSNLQSEHLRSLFLTPDPDKQISRRNLSSLKYFTLLKTLYVEMQMQMPSSGRLPDEYRALIGLKYLRIRGVGVLRLPKWFNRLKNLEVVEIDEGYVILPNVKWKMDSLRHFCAPSIDGPLGKDAWKNLETLKRINPVNKPSTKPVHIPSSVRKLGMILKGETDLRVAAESLGKLKNLAHLHLTRLGRGLDFHPIFRAISDLEHLIKLKVLGPMINGLPKPDMFPRNISRVTFVGYEGRDFYFTYSCFIVLGQLPKLTHLKLSDLNFENLEMIVLRDGFPLLQVLSLRNLDGLRCIHIEEGGMPQLRQLDIFHCLDFHTQNLYEHLDRVCCRYS